MSNYGAKVSKPNFNVQTAKDARNLIVTSDYPGLHIFNIVRKNFKYTANSASAFRTITIPHNYTNGTPAFMAFYSKNGVNHPIQHNEVIDTTTFQFDAWANSSEITCCVFNNTSDSFDQFFDFTVYIFAEKLG